jgi:hypothetical protein
MRARLPDTRVATATVYAANGKGALTIPAMNPVGFAVAPSFAVLEDRHPATGLRRRVVHGGS